MRLYSTVETKDLKSAYFHGVRLFLSERNGGVSKGVYSSLNIAYHVGDEPHLVKKNRAIAIEMAGLASRRLFSLTQVHGNVIHEVSENSIECELVGDGLMTRDPNVALLIMVADCNPIALYDQHERALCLLHAGREGVRLRILTHAINQMREKYGSETQNIKLYIGASIRSCCYEVGRDIAERFAREGLGIGVGMHDDRHMLDLIACLHNEAQSLKIPPENIFIDERCSACDERLFSYRRDGITGRMGLFGGLV